MQGQRLKELRLNSGMTQKTLADLLRISPSTIGMYEQNRRSPDADILLRISRIFSTTTDWLLGNDAPACAILPACAETELSELISDLSRTLAEKQRLTFNGVPLTKEDISKIMAAMREGAEIVYKKNRKNIPGGKNRTRIRVTARG